MLFGIVMVVLGFGGVVIFVGFEGKEVFIDSIVFGFFLKKKGKKKKKMWIIFFFMFEIVFGVSIYLRVINCWFYIYFMDILWVNLFDVMYNFFFIGVFDVNNI